MHPICENQRSFDLKPRARSRRFLDSSFQDRDLEAGGENDRYGSEGPCREALSSMTMSGDSANGADDPAGRVAFDIQWSSEQIADRREGVRHPFMARNVKHRLRRNKAPRPPLVAASPNFKLPYRFADVLLAFHVTRQRHRVLCEGILWFHQRCDDMVLWLVRLRCKAGSTQPRGLSRPSLSRRIDSFSTGILTLIFSR
jgi:hypothetical protein